MNTFRQPFIETRFFGPTDTKPSRIKALNVTSKNFIWVSYHTINVNSPMDAHEMAARKMLGHGNVYQGDLLACGTDRGYIFTPKVFNET